MTLAVRRPRNATTHRGIPIEAQLETYNHYPRMQTSTRTVRIVRRRGIARTQDRFIWEVVRVC